MNLTNQILISYEIQTIIRQKYQKYIYSIIRSLLYSRSLHGITEIKTIFGIFLL